MEGFQLPVPTQHNEMIENEKYNFPKINSAQQGLNLLLIGVENVLQSPLTYFCNF